MRKIILSADIDEWRIPVLPVKRGEPARIALSLTKHGKDYNVENADLSVFAERPSGGVLESTEYSENKKVGEILKNICSKNINITSDADTVTLDIGEKITEEPGELILTLKLRKRRKEYDLGICGVVI